MNIFYDIVKWSFFGWTMAMLIYFMGFYSGQIFRTIAHYSKD